MTTLTLDLDLDVAADAIVPGDAPRERPTLDELVVGVWEGLHAHHPAPCPIWSGTMTPRYGPGPRPVGGRCGDCGTGLA
jgi:hypothetical protein